MNNSTMVAYFGGDPEVRYTQGTNPSAVARFSVAEHRRRTDADGKRIVNWWNCVAFGKNAEFIEKYMRKGTKVVMTGEYFNDNYVNKDGQKIYRTSFEVHTIEFAESKKSEEGNAGGGQVRSNGDGFMNIPDGIEEELPFN